MDKTVKCGNALAEAHVALRDWPKAKQRLEHAQIRIASGLDSRLHTERDEGALEGSARGMGDDQAMLAAFLKVSTFRCSQPLTAISRGRQDERAKLMVCLPTPRTRSTARLDRYPKRLTPSSLPPPAQILIWGDTK